MHACVRLMMMWLALLLALPLLALTINSPPPPPEHTRAQCTRPVVTLAYAQTLDGCLAWAGRHAAEISCPQALAMTHGLRASHDCILVGAGTLQQDNPHLGVRLPTRRWRWGWLLGWRRQCRSPDPRPVVLVSAVPQEGEAPPLSSSASIPSWWWWGQPKPAAEPPPLPFDPAALRLARPPIVFTPDLPQLVRRLGGEAAVDALKADGWDFVACAAAEENGDSSRGKGKGHHRRCDVRDCLRRLKAEFGCRSVMVEGGARVLTACLRAGVVDVVCLTVAPAIMAPGAGHRAIQGGLTKGRRGGVRAWLARFKGREWELLRVGTDAVLVGVPERSRLC